LEDPIGRWLIEGALLFLCALLSCAQSALKNANEGKLRAAVQEDRRLKVLEDMMDDSRAEISFRGLKTLLTLLMAGLGCRFFLAADAPWWMAAVFCLAATPVVMILGKMLPEKVGKKRADSLIVHLRWLILPITWLMTPLTLPTRFLSRQMAGLFGVDPHAREEEVTEEEIRAMVDIGEESGVIESEEREMLKNVFEFGDMTAAECMTHRTDVTALWIDDDEETILTAIRETGLSRFPVYNEDIDDVVGVLTTRDYLLNMGLPQPKPMKDLLRNAYFVPETVPTDVLLRNMQRAKTHIAIVVDEYGGMSGLVTMEDLLEEIVGNIYDEFDPQDEGEIQPLGQDEWRISGSAALDTLAETMGIALPQADDFDTLGGWIFSRFSTIPDDGATPTLTLYCTQEDEAPDREEECDRLLIQVEKIEDRRVEWAKVKLLRKITDEDEEEAE